jgi:hypothetical protein
MCAMQVLFIEIFQHIWRFPFYLTDLQNCMFIISILGNKR